VSVSNAPPPPMVSIAVGPPSAILTTSQSQQFTGTVSGSGNTGVSWSINPAVGIISSGGLYTAPATITSVQTVTVIATSQADPTKTATAAISLTPPPPSVAITLGPANVSLTVSQIQQFAATITGSSNNGVVWTLSPPLGTIVNGLYTAPATITTAQRVILTATSLADSSKSASAAIDLTVLPPPVSVSLGPANTSLSATQTQQFTATVTGSSNTSVSWSLSPQVGTIANGLYTAPATIATAQTVVVTATSAADPTKSASASIALTPTVSISLGPANTNLSATQTQQFTATVTGSANTGVSWSLSPQVGSITNGLYTAPPTIATAQTVVVTATSAADPTKTATASISLTPTVSISLGPANTSLSASQTQQFTATVTGAGNTGVSWSLNPQVGAISNSGIYTAPAAITTAQNVAVTARSLADTTKTATAVVALTPVVAITLGPSNVSLSTSGTQQFTATVTGASQTGVSWSISPTVGTISSSGLFTAPAAITSAQNVIVTASSIADLTKTAVAVIALTVTAPPPGSAPLNVSINSPINGSRLNGTAVVSATANANAGVAGVQFFVDAVPIAAEVTTPPYVVNWDTTAVSDGTHNLSAMARDTAGNRSTATVSVSVSNTTPVSAVTLPVEVIGPDGFTQTVQLNVPSVPAGTLRLWLQIHGVKYQTEASVQVNNSPWIPINDSTVTLLGQAAAYGGIGGGFRTLKLTLNLPQGSVTAGMNTLRFRFNGTDGRVSGFRVLALNVVGPDGSALVPPTAFTNDDPNTWQPPSTLASDIAAGKAFWYTAPLTVPTTAGPAAIQATCTGCHAQDGRDLKYFNYSNSSIRARAIFHGLTAQQGDQIASYIRSLNLPNPGRPWNPPYQPGPGLDSQPVERWSAGAGIDAVLNSDQELLSELFPNGIQPAAFSASGNLNVRQTSIPLQLADWNSWLPTVHPMDGFSDFAASNFNGRYLALRSQLKYADPVAYANSAALFLQWPADEQIFLTNGNKTPNQATSTPGFWTPDYINKVYSTSLWAMVKSWELNQEFALEGMAQSIFTNPQADSRAWFSRFPFSASPNILHIPRGVPGLENGKVSTFVYLSFTWYQTQLILNNSNKQQDGDSPIDWQYVYGFVAELSANASPGQTGMQYLWQLKGLQISNNGSGPDSAAYPWRWEINDPMLQVYQGPSSTSIWTGTTSTQRVALYEGMVRALLDVVEKFTPQQFYAGGWASPIVVPLPGAPFGNFGDRVWYSIPLLRSFGVNQLLINEFADWAKTIWPLGAWDLLKTDTCFQSTYGATCLI
jgi:hypothetical protein